MFEFIVNKSIYNDKRRILAYLLTQIVKKLKTSVEQKQGGNNITYNQSLNIIFNVRLSSMTSKSIKIILEHLRALTIY